MTNIALQKFGTTLVSRQAGREAYAAFQPELKNIPFDENIEVDFENIVTFSPSWGDEFLTPLLAQYPNTVLKGATNASVVKTLETLETIRGSKFRIIE